MAIKESVLAGVYGLVFTDKQGKSYWYIGETSNLKRRKETHLSNGVNSPNFRLAKAFKDFGIPYILVLQEENDKDKRLVIEAELIQKFRASLNLKVKGKYGLEYCVEGQPVSFDEYMAFELCRDWGCPDSNYGFFCDLPLPKRKGKSSSLKSEAVDWKNYNYQSPKVFE